MKLGSEVVSRLLAGNPRNDYPHRHLRPAIKRLVNRHVRRLGRMEIRQVITAVDSPEEVLA